MAPTESEIRALLTQGYAPSSIPPLEAYLDAQVNGEAPYVFDAVRTLVKLYQIFPNDDADADADTKNESKIALCLMLALLHKYPSTDLLALCYLVPQLFSREPFAAIRKCGEYLDGCKYSDFWKAFEQLQSSDDIAVSNLASGAVPKLQRSILDVLALSYREAPASVVAAALNVDETTVQTAVPALKHPLVEKVTADAVVFVSTADNTKRQRVYQEGVTFSTISSLIGKMAQ